jgi:flagellar export protein FliJ
MAEQLVTQARADLTSALQARRVLSRLRDKHFTNWQQEDNAQEMRTMDELALTRYTRRDKSGMGEGGDNGAASA